MTNDNASRANEEHMPKRIRMTRQEMQDTALSIEMLLDAALALQNADDATDAMTIVEMAQERAKRLNKALDQVNVVKEPA